MITIIETGVKMAGKHIRFDTVCVQTLFDGSF